MGKAIIKTEDGVTSITCIRGPVASLDSIVKDKRGNEWYCKKSKKEFDLLNNEYPLEVFDSKGKFQKKFLKGFLTFVRENTYD